MSGPRMGNMGQMNGNRRSNISRMNLHDSRPSHHDHRQQTTHHESRQLPTHHDNRHLTQQLSQPMNSQHEDLVKYIHDSWSKIEMDQTSSNVMYYQEQENHRLKDFRPFDLEAFWGRRMHQAHHQHQSHHHHQHQTHHQHHS